MAAEKGATSKPPYRVPSMEEIRAIEPNGFGAISLFAGCGGSSLGYRMAGFKMLWASEFVEAAAKVYAANKAPWTIVNDTDIRHVDTDLVMKRLKIKPGDLDLLDGSPPCASFSTAGKRSEDWGKEKKYSDKVQRTDDLFGEYVRFVDAIRPKVFVAENVSGLIKGVAKGHFIEIMRALKACGYRVEARLLDAQWLGVPQARERLIFVGVREDLGLAPAFPQPLSCRYSVREAVADLSAPVEPETDITRFAIGAESARLNPGQQSDKYFSLVRAPLDGPSPTVTAAGGGHESGNSIASVMHPTEKRKFSIAELKRLCSFPDDFALSGTYSQQWERLGRAVPPLMMRAVAETIREAILVPLRSRTAAPSRRSPGRSTKR